MNANSLAVLFTITALLGTGALNLGCTKVTREERKGDSEVLGLTLGDEEAGNGSGGSTVSFYELTPVACVIKTAQDKYWRNSSTQTMDFECTAADEEGKVKSVEKVECQLNDGAWINCDRSKQHRLTGLVNGPQRFRVRGTAKVTVKGVETQAVGHSAYALWAVDTDPPVVESAAHTGWTGDSPIVQFAGRENTGPQSGVHRFECRLTKRLTQWQECSSPFTFQAIPNANDRLQLEVRAIDVAGNVSATFTSGYISVATYVYTPASTCTITQVLPVWSALKNQSISFQCTGPDVAAEGTVIECRVDKGVWGACTSSTSHLITNLGDGAHFFEVRYRTNRGFVSLAPVVSWGVDTRAPDVMITSRETPGLTARFEFSAIDLALDKQFCQLQADGQTTAAPWIECSSPHAYSSGIQLGKFYTFQVKARDRAGNESVPASHRWYASPGVTPTCIVTTTMPNGVSKNSSETIEFGCSLTIGEIIERQCKFDGGAWGPCSYPTQHRLSGIPSGTHTFSVRAKDAAGNWGDPSLPLTWRTDLDRPTVRISHDVSHPNARITFEGNDRDTTDPLYYTCSVATGGATPVPYSPCVSPLSLSGLVLDQSYSVTVLATDSAGWVSDPAIAVWTSRPAVPAPVCTIVRPTGMSSPTSQSTWTFDVNCSGEAVVRYECSSNFAGFTGCTFPLTYRATLSPTQSSHQCFAVRGIDRFGRAGPSDQFCWNYQPYPTAGSGNSGTGIIATATNLRRIFTRGNGPIAPTIRDDIQFSFVPSRQGFTQVLGGFASNYDCKLESNFSPRMFPDQPGLVDVVDADWVPCRHNSSHFVRGNPQAGRLPGVTYTFRVRPKGVTHGSNLVSYGTESRIIWTNGKWSDWSTCQGLCGQVGARSRTCTTPVPSTPWGVSCYGASTESCTGLCP